MINHFHGQAKGLGSVLHPVPQGPAHALLYLPRNALDLCCYFLKVKSTVPVGIRSRVRAAQSRVFAIHSPLRPKAAGPEQADNLSQDLPTKPSISYLLLLFVKSTEK